MLVWTKRERLILFVAWLGWTFDIMDAALFNFAKVPLVTEILGGPARYKIHGPEAEASLLYALMIGWTVGGVGFGWLADRIGRIKVMTITILLYSLFTGLTVLCSTLPQLVGVRFLTGLGIGGEWAAGAALVAECVSDEKRARAASWLQSAAAIGPCLAAIANLSLINFGWRSLYLVGVIPALVGGGLRFFVKETPTVKSKEKQKVEWSTFWKPATVGIVLGIAGIAVAQNITFWLPNLVNQLSAGELPEVIKARQSQAALVLHIGTFLGVFAVPQLCTMIGRRLTMLVCFLLAPASVWAVAQLAKDYNTLLILAPIMAFFGIGLSAAFVLYFPELFPARLRATGAGISYNGGRVIAAFIPFLTALLIRTQGDVAKSIAQTSFLLAFGVIALAFAPETKGKPIEI